MQRNAKSSILEPGTLEPSSLDASRIHRNTLDVLSPGRAGERSRVSGEQEESHTEEHTQRSFHPTMKCGELSFPTWRWTSHQSQPYSQTEPAWRCYGPSATVAACRPRRWRKPVMSRRARPVHTSRNSLTRACWASNAMAVSVATGSRT